jgi:DNA-binding response OmpR family regulator
MRVLLIEDDISVAQSIKLMLQRHDAQISVADLGEHGIDLAGSRTSTSSCSTSTSRHVRL